MCADLSRVESQHFLKKLLPPFFATARLRFAAKFNATAARQCVKSESNQARSLAFSAMGGEPAANAWATD
jgi:hypothetical protein